MKKKFLVIALLAALLIGLTACVSKGGNDYESNTTLLAIHGANDLYYDSQTKVVYFVFNEQSIGGFGYGYMSAYYAPNGLPYLYDPYRQELVEISYTQAEQTAGGPINFRRAQTGL